jgi:hypothetical protein
MFAAITSENFSFPPPILNTEIKTQNKYNVLLFFMGVEFDISR